MQRVAPWLLLLPMAQISQLQPAEPLQQALLQQRKKVQCLRYRLNKTSTLSSINTETTSMQKLHSQILRNATVAHPPFSIRSNS